MRSRRPVTKGGRVRSPRAASTAEEYGAELSAVMQVHGDRVAILKLLRKLPASERKLLPEVQQTADALYQRATDLARTLHAMDSNFDVGASGQIDERIAGLTREPDDPNEARRLRPLERQRQTIDDLRGRRRPGRQPSRVLRPRRCRTSGSTCSG